MQKLKINIPPQQPNGDGAAILLTNDSTIQPSQQEQHPDEAVELATSASNHSEKKKKLMKKKKKKTNKTACLNTASAVFLPSGAFQKYERPQLPPQISVSSATFTNTTPSQSTLLDATDMPTPMTPTTAVHKQLVGNIHQHHNSSTSTTTTTATSSDNDGKGETKKTYLKQNVLKSLTVGIVLKYKLCSSEFKYTNPKRIITQPSDPAGNNGADNVDGNLILSVDDVLGGRYCVKDVLGQGTFGQVARCEDLENVGRQVAVKVIKNKRAYLKQAQVETRILELLCNKYDPDDTHHIIRLHHHFYHQNHLCIVFELLGINLFELIKQNRFRGLSTNVISVFLSQILDALCVLQDARIIHCDMKPENILLTDLSSPKNLVKLIDFGSACLENETVYSYIQSRFYRSPDVLFGLEYNTSIDIWSLGCICAELFLGLPLFPGVSQYNQVARIVEMLGLPPACILDTGRLSKKYFKRKTTNSTPWGRTHNSSSENVDDNDSDTNHPYELKTEQEYCLENNETPKEWKRYFNYKKLDDLIIHYTYKNIPQEEVKKEEANRLAFIDLLYGLLQWDPNKRWTAHQARKHPFVTGEPFTGPYVPDPDPTRVFVPMKMPVKQSGLFMQQQQHYHGNGSLQMPILSSSWGQANNTPPTRKMSGAYQPPQAQQFLSPPSTWGSVASSSGSGSATNNLHVPVGNLGPSPNMLLGSSPYGNSLGPSAQEKQGIPIGGSQYQGGNYHQHQQYQQQQQQHQHTQYNSYGMSPMYGGVSPMSSAGAMMGMTPSSHVPSSASSSWNMPTMYGTPSSSFNNSIPSYSPQQQQHQGRWGRKNSRAGLPDASSLLSDQFNSQLQLGESPHQHPQHQQRQQRHRSNSTSAWSSPNAVGTTPPSSRSRRDSNANRPPPHPQQTHKSRRRPSIAHEHEPAMLSSTLLSGNDAVLLDDTSSPPLPEPSELDNSNWNPFFPDEDLDLEESSDMNNNKNHQQKFNQQFQHHHSHQRGGNGGGSYNPYHGSTSQKGGFNQNNNNGSGRSRGNSFRNRSGSFKSQPSSFVSSSSYGASDTLMSSSIGDSTTPPFGYSPANNGCALGSSPSSYNSTGIGSYQQQQQAGGTWRNHNNNHTNFGGTQQPQNRRQQKR